MSKKKKTNPTPVSQPQRKAQPRAVPVVKDQYWWFGLVAAALGLLLYANTMGYTYCLDDFSSIKENWVVKGGLKNLGTIFSTEYRYGAWSSPGSLYRPIPLVMFALEWQLSPDNPSISHIVNIIFYGLTGWALWITWRRILAGHPPILAALTVLFFMVLPVHSEVVANIKSRDEIMSLLFSTYSLYAIWRYFETGKNSWMVGATALYGLAMFCKEGAITYLAIFPLTMWFFTSQPLSKIIRVTAILAVPAFFFLFIRWRVLAAQPYQEIYSILDNFMVGATPGERYASAFMMCWKYLSTLIVPVSLVSDMGYPQMKVVNFGDWRALLGFVSYGAMFVWSLLNLKKKHFLSYAILIYLAAFSVFSNVLIMIGTSYGERLLYLPSMGYALALAWLVCKVFKIGADTTELWGGKLSTVWMVAGAILVAYGLRTVVRNPAWYDSASLYNADIIQSPNSAKLNYHYGLELVKTGMNEKTGVVTDSTWVLKGVDTYSKAIKLFPQYHDAYGSRGLAYFRMNKFNQAYDDYITCLQYRPNDAKVLSNLGYIYFMRGQYDKAEDVYRKSIQYDPRFIDARRNLGAILAMRKEFPAAMEQWQEGLKYEPNNATLLFYMGSAYKDMGQPEKAQPWFDKAYAIEPSLKK
jgi:tetratricopeptide (TPR) repeat protein